jgi:hypothetical protein
MIKPDRAARGRSLLCGCFVSLLFAASGCAEMLPNAESWEKLSPSSIWYYMHPNQLSRMSETECEPISDAYYSISDLPERDRSTTAANRPSGDAARTIQPIDSPLTRSEP